MNRENYQRVKEIFQAVLELAPDERRPHLDRVCTDDPALRGGMRHLEGDGNAESFAPGA